MEDSRRYLEDPILPLTYGPHPVRLVGSPGFTGKLDELAGESEGTNPMTVGTLLLDANGNFLADNYTLDFNGWCIVYDRARKRSMLTDYNS